MSERTAAYQKAQLGVETSLGGGATINKRLVSIGVKAAPKVLTSPFTPQGSLLPTIIPIGKDYTEASYDCSPIYEEIGLIFASLFAKENEATPGLYAINGAAPNIPDTYEFEIGDGTNCEGFTGAVFNSLSLKWNREKLDVSGDLLGQAMDTTVWTASATPPASITPMLPSQVTIKMGNTEAGVTKLNRCFSADFDISGRWKDLWVLDAAQPSYVALVETPLKANIKLMMEADSEGKAFLTSVRGNNPTKVIDFESVSGTKSFHLVAATKVESIDEFGDNDGVYAIGVNLAVVYDASLGLAMKATVDAS